jgi:arginyl-tRNA synthetase
MIYDILLHEVAASARRLFDSEISHSQLQVQKTKKEFEGDFTIVLFGIAKQIKKSPEEAGKMIGADLLDNMPGLIAGYNVIKGFLNLSISDDFWLNFFAEALEKEKFGFAESNKKTPVVLEFSSPNTNKPLHLGHIRNNLLGHSLAEILKATGENVIKLNLVNDRGIHICKSMLAWKLWGNHESPWFAQMKGDHLVGKYYVLFDQRYKAELRKLTEQGLSPEEAEKRSSLMGQAREMLRRWENSDPDVRELWKTMNGWVYEGFAETYTRLGIAFDKTDYESETYLRGKSIVEKGVADGKLYRKPDNSVWADLSEFKLDEKLLLRSDGTSVYMTQDIGTACMRHDSYQPAKMIYVVGNEQNHHFEVLRNVLQILGYDWAQAIHHLSYGMVELPQGKMKSREGTVVDADDLMNQMIDTARQTTTELGKVEDFSEDERNYLFHILGLGALKYFILKVDPRKTMLFNPKDSIDFNGHTGPFIQYTHARIRSVARKATDAGRELDDAKALIADYAEKLPAKEKELLKMVYDFPVVLQEAAQNLSPATIAAYVYELAREFNQFYNEFSILHEGNEELAKLRLALSVLTARVIKNAMLLLGIDVPERM